MSVFEEKVLQHEDKIHSLIANSAHLEVECSNFLNMSDRAFLIAEQAMITFSASDMSLRKLVSDFAKKAAQISEAEGYLGQARSNSEMLSATQHRINRLECECCAHIEKYLEISQKMGDVAESLLRADTSCKDLVGK